MYLNTLSLIYYSYPTIISQINDKPREAHQDLLEQECNKTPYTFTYVLKYAIFNSLFPRSLVTYKTKLSKRHEDL